MPGQRLIGSVWARTADPNAVCGGWVTMRAKTPYAIFDSFNVSGVTENGTGDVTITWSHAFPNGAYAVAGTAQTNDTTTGCRVQLQGAVDAGSVRVLILDNTTLVSADILGVAAWGNAW